MVGNDWPYENNPTDAEVIDKIAKDAQSGGGGSDLVVDVDDFEDIPHEKPTPAEFEKLVNLNCNMYLPIDSVTNPVIDFANLTLVFGTELAYKAVYVHNDALDLVKIMLGADDDTMQMYYDPEYYMLGVHVGGGSY